MAFSPRPILKRTASTPSAEKHAVHFPPHNTLTRTFTAHSSAAYDRSPIVVAPNTCALPERGGRTYILDESSMPTPPCKKASMTKASRGLHPRALRDMPSHQLPSMPSLIPDLSSESDESDGFPSPHLENQEFFFSPNNPHGLKSSDDAANALSFLPYSPSQPYYPSSTDDAQVEKPRRRKERKHDAPRDNRIRNSPSDNDEETTPTPTPTLTPRRIKLSRTHSSSFIPSTTSTFSPSHSLCDSFSSFNLRDDGCLGGF